MNSTTLPACSQQFSQILMNGVQDMLGFEKMQQVVRPFLGEGEPRSWAELEGLLFRVPVALESAYGSVAGRGLAVRIGRAAFDEGLRKLGEPAGLLSAEFHLLPVPRRLKTGLHILTEVLARECGAHVTIEEEDAAWFWRSENCPLCWGRQSVDPCCYLTVGVLKAFFSWASGGRSYRVTEVACRAAGDPPCLYRLDKTPLD